MAFLTLRYLQIFAAIIITSTSLFADIFNPSNVTELIADINTANSNNEDDVIDLALGPFILTAAYSGFDGLPEIGPDGNHSLLLQNGTIERDSGSPDLFRLIDIDADANLSLNGVSLIGGNVPVPENGGAILVNGTLSSAINSSFSNNKASFGGAIAIINKATLIKNCSFKTNLNSTQGGAIAVLGSLDSLLESFFTANTAGTGGAIIVRMGGTLGLISRTSFEDNSVSGSGGALVVYGQIATIEDSLFARNTAIAGGAISISEEVSGSATGLIDNINRCLFAGNSASVEGGAIIGSIINGTSRPHVANRINDSKFIANRAMIGGGIMLQGVSLTSIDNSGFVSNTGTSSGGAIFSGSSAISEIKNSSFIANEALDSFVGDGAAIDMQSENLGSVNVPSTIGLIANSTFSYNKSMHNGACIAMSTEGGVGSVNIGLLSNCTLADNSAGNVGGALFLPYLDSISKITSTIIARNKAVVSAPDVSALAGAVPHESFNLIGINNGSDFIAGMPNKNLSYVGTALNPLDPGLAPLANNGGPTETRALLPEGLAIDRGDNPLNLAFDQRGFDFVRTSGFQTDIGAFELQRKSEKRCHHEDSLSEPTNFGLMPSPFAPGAVAPIVAPLSPPAVVVTPAPGAAPAEIASPVAKATSSILSATPMSKNMDKASGCSSIGGIGQGLTNLILIMFTVLKCLRMTRSAKKSQPSKV